MISNLRNVFARFLTSYNLIEMNSVLLVIRVVSLGNRISSM